MTSLDRNETDDYYEESLEYLHTKALNELITDDIFEWNRLHTKNDNTKITSQIWSVVVSWLYECKVEFDGVTHVLAQAIEIINHYLQTTVISKNDFQKVGITAYLIADKKNSYNNSITLDDAEYISAKTYSREEFIECELDILEKLDYQINYVTMMDYRNYYGDIKMWDDPKFQFILESSLMNLRLYNYLPFDRLLAVQHLYYQIQDNPTPVLSSEVFECIEILDTGLRKPVKPMVDDYGQDAQVVLALFP